ncbi:MAG: N-acetylneuraminate synthase family protein [Sulfuricurvum sp.]|nr:N-acetylneuraminate synthase family protein [Sulfuricurvum sp.]
MLNTLDKTFIIAEIGSNHNQSLSLAFEMIDAAKENGADAVKFQSIDVEALYFQPNDSIKALHRKIDLEESWHRLLKEYCDQKEILFFSSPTYLAAVDILEEIGVELYKLASAQVGTFPQIIDKVASTGKATLLSTGIVSYAQLHQAVSSFQHAGNDNFMILHCNSIYPTPYEKVHLNLLQIYEKMFNKPVGFSDHTDDIYASLAAVTLGAKVIERHFTLDKKIPVPDASISILPDQFRRMTEGIRAIEASMIPGVRIDIEAQESSFKEQILYRLVAKRKLTAGKPLTSDDFEYKRHPEGIDCRDLPTVLSHMVPAADIDAHTLITWAALKGKS